MSSLQSLVSLNIPSSDCLGEIFLLTNASGLIIKDLNLYLVFCPFLKVLANLNLIHS